MTNPSQGFAPNVASLTDMFMSYSNRLFPPSTELREVHVHINFKTALSCTFIEKEDLNWCVERTSDDAVSNRFNIVVELFLGTVQAL